MSHLLPSTVTALTTKTPAKTIKTTAATTKITTTIVNTNSSKKLSTTTAAAAIPKKQQLFNNTKPRKRRRKRENPQAAAATEDYDSDDSYPMSCSDVESFQGKIVYNPDGSAYIIDSENDTFSNVSDNCMSVDTSSENATTCINIDAATTPTVTNPSPKIHSFRVVTANDANVNTNSEPNRSLKIQKPILMCFICKLSFGNTKSFTLHANSEHALNLQESEKQLLNREYSSAIIQRNVDEKPQVSFLEPLETVPPLATETITATVTRKKDFAPIVTTTTAATILVTTTEKNTTTVAVDCSSSSSGCNNQSKNSTSNMSSNSTDEQPNNISITQQQQQQQQKQQHIVSVDLMTNSPTAATNMPATQLSPSNSSCTTTTTTTSINYGSLQTATTKTTATTPATADVLASAAAESSSSSSQILAAAATVALCSTSNKTNLSSTDNLSSMYTLRHSTTPNPVSTPTYASTTMSCNSAPQSPQSTPSTTAAPSSVVDYLQQQLQQHMHRITSPSAAATLAVVSTLTSNVSNVPDITTNTNTVILQQQQQQLPPPPTTLAQHNNLSSLHASLAALASDQSSNSVKLINDFLQHQLAAQHHHHQQQQQSLSLPTTSGCPEHPDTKGIDCKSCEMSEIHQLKSPLTPQRSPNSSMSGSMLQVTNSQTTSPTTSTAGGNVSTTPTAVSAASFTIGACPEHINGRPLGMDCARCEMILNSARLNSGVQMSTRNSCKTLKCPQCNWHYKYQETLEIHMREKHPDGESACGYCLAGQQHPRLARGESYTCGYKPYRCEICNYSTTTKGNLSIHMQSDKHLNNMQELNSTQNMAAAAAAAVAVAASNNQAAADASPKMLLSSNMAAAAQTAQQQQQQQHQNSAPSSSTSSTASAANKPKPTFRCDVCSYETSVARNLRIHMTSEKHTHNMAVLQNNIKHIQAFSYLQQQQQQAAAAAQQQQQAAAQQQMNPLSTATVLPGALGSSFLPEAALADLAYNQALMIQLLHQNSAAGALAAAAAASNQPLQQHTPKTHLQISLPSPAATSTGGGGSCNQPTSYSPNKSPSLTDSGVAAELSLAAAAAGVGGGALSQDALDPSIEPDLRPTTFYSCLVCANYNTNSLDELNQHLLIDRSRQHMASNSSEIMLILNNNYICRLCNYKTNLKANFQLHSKTDKHLQKLNFINHIREGGMRNEYKLKYHQISTNTVQLKCNCCDFYTNSIQKLSLHTQHMRHDTMKIIFQHLLYLMKEGGMLLMEKKAIASDCNAASGTDVSGEAEHYNDSSNTNKALLCQLCNFTSTNLLQMMQHIKSLRHIQVEQFIGLQRRSEGLDSLNLEDAFKVSEAPTVSRVDCIKSERTSPEPMLGINDNSTIACLIENNSTRDENNSLMNLDNCFFDSAGSGTSISSKFGPSPNMAGTDLSAASSCLPSVIHKCSNCDYFSQSKQEMEHHIEELHPNSVETDFISIPTNAAAIHAFQAAIVAATAAAAASATHDQKSPEAQKSSQDEDDDDEECPVVIKKERLTDEHDGGAADENEESSAAVIHMEVESLQTAATDGSNNTTNVSAAATSVQCPLCQENFTEKNVLEMHLMGVHSVSRDGLARLLQLVDTSCWQQNVQKVPKASAEAVKTIGGSDVVTIESSLQQSSAASVSVSGAIQNVEQSVHTPGAAVIDNTELSCLQCGNSFKLQQQLLMHAQDTQHYPMQHAGEYQCLVSKQCPLLFHSVTAMIAHYKDTHMNLVISERHVYKYRCKQCSLAFKTQEKLATHTLYHTMRDATKCGLCQRNFRSTQSLQKHMDQVHNNVSQSQQLPSSHTPQQENIVPIQQQHTGCKSPMTSPSSSSSLANIAETNTAAPVAAAIPRDQEATNTLDTTGMHPIRLKVVDDDVSIVGATVNATATNKLVIEGREQVRNHSHIHDQLHDMSSINKHQQPPATDSTPPISILSFSVFTASSDKKTVVNEVGRYLAPKRPFNCNICRESFTHKNILIIHFNSVSHLNKAKKLLRNGCYQKNIERRKSHIDEVAMPSVQINEIDLKITNHISSSYIKSNKPYKCDICRVSFAQGSTLDIHLRSVLHQMRSSKQRKLKEQTQQHKKIAKATFNHNSIDIDLINNSKKQMLLSALRLHTQVHNLDISESTSNCASFLQNLNKSLLNKPLNMFTATQVQNLNAQFANNNTNVSSNLKTTATSPTASYQRQQQQQQTNNQYFLNIAQKLHHSEDSLALSPGHSDAMETKESPIDSNTSQTAPPSPASMSMPHQHQHAAAIAALLRQQQQQRSAADAALERSSPDAVMLQQLQMDPAMLAQKIMEQNLQQAAAHFPNLTPQNLQSLQNLQNLQQMQQMQQQLPQMAAAAAASGISMNPVDMLNLMQFHHLMSLNFMNLAPPLIFGGGSANAPGTTNSGASGVAATATNISATLGSTNVNNSIATSTNISGASAAGVPSNEAAQAAQLLQQQQQASPVAAAAAAAAATQISNNQKRARTRITDDQLKILRAHFDINNSPSEESITEMSKKANLPMKVVKHWFRNTLFKERQRNKDSPYNFNNPPSTTLNLEEYERTGQAKVTSLGETNCTSGGNSVNTPIVTTTISGAISSANSSCIQPHQQQQQQNQLALHHNPRPDSAQSSNAGDYLSNSGHLNFSQQQHEIQRQNNERPRSHASSVASGSCPLDVQIKSEPTDDAANSDNDQQQQHILTPTSAMLLKHQQLAAIAAAAAANEHHQSAELNEHTVMQAAAAAAAAAAVSAHQQQHHHNFYNSYETKSESGSSDILSRPQTPNSASASTNPYTSMSDLLGQQLDSLPLNNMSNMNNMGPPKKFQMSKVFEKNSPSSQFETNSNSSNSSSTSSGKRANRTRFTDYQIKVLQEFFENNSYPKDSDLEYLSKLLLLSPRVIVVWFQNARQKQRKIYENQPNNSFYETEEKKQNINYACKKCNLVFQRYYELIRHQKNHCFKEENNKKSAKAQIAAAQIAQSLSSEDSNSSIDISNAAAAASLLTGHHQQHVAAVAAAAALAAGTTTPGPSPSPSLNLLGTSPQHHLFGKSSSSVAVGGCMTVDCSPSTTPTPPQQRERSSSIDQQHTKFECEKCQLTFSRYEQFREHQLIHIMNPSLFGGQQQHPTLSSGQQQNIPSEAIADYSPFGGILQSLQQVASAAAVNHQQHHHQHQQHETLMDISRSQQQQQEQQKQQLKKRKFSDASSHTDEMLGATDCEMQINKKFKSEQYDFLYQYYMQNETNMDLKQAIQQQQQQSPDLELEYLSNFYQQTEIKKRSNYDFLFEYYLRNEQQQQQPTNFDAAANKPNIDFLLQYYQLSESKKFFQLDASPQRIHDCNKPTRATTPTSSIDRDADSNNSYVYGHNHRHGNNVVNNNSNYNNSSSNSSTNSNGGKNDHVAKCANNVLEVDNIADGDIVMQRRMQQQNHVAPQAVDDVADDDYSENAAALSDTDSVDNNSSNNNNNNNCNIEQQAQQLGSEVNQNLGQNEINETNQKTPAIDEIEQQQRQSPTTGNRNSSSNCQFPLGQVNFNNLEEFLDATMIENQTHALIFNETLVDAATATALKAPTTTTSSTTLNTAAAQQQHTATAEHKQNKRLRTTILPEQLNFLYECYQNESNPSRKMLEEISKKVNLKKRVVQVWYQNSRARERKGQFRQNFQIINKKCPYCNAIFKIKSALEWHLQSKHSDRPKMSIEQIADIKIDVDQIDNNNQEIKHEPPPNTSIRQLQQQIKKPLDLSRAQQLQQSQILLTTISNGNGDVVDCNSNNNKIKLLNTLSIASFLQAQRQKNHEKHKNQQQQQETSAPQVETANKNVQNQLVVEASSYCSSLKAALISTTSLSSAASASTSSSSSSSSSSVSSTASTSFLSLATAMSSAPSPTPSNISLSLSLETTGLSLSSSSSAAIQKQQQQHQKQHKRFRTQMNHTQIRILRMLFKDVKSPTMSDCLSIGREIGLQKRVIQVWFQNARAKDKKSRHQRYVSEDSNCDDKTRDGFQAAAVIKAVELRDCQLCQLQQVNIHQHAFSAEHIGRVKALLERTQLIKSQNQKYTNGNGADDSDDDDQQIHADENEENKQQQQQHQIIEFQALELELLQQQQQHQIMANSKTEDSVAANNNNNDIIHNILKRSGGFNQEQPFLLYEKDPHTSNGIGSVVNSTNSHKLENNLMLKINSADDALDADVADTHTHSNDIIQQLFNCNQMSVIGSK